MARYVDADLLKERIEYYYSHTGDQTTNAEHYAYGVALKEIENQPTADVVEAKQIEIIRDDLKWWLETNTEKGVVYIPEFVVENMIKKMTRTPKEREGES